MTRKGKLLANQLRPFVGHSPKTEAICSVIHKWSVTHKRLIAKRLEEELTEKEIDKINSIETRIIRASQELSVGVIFDYNSENSVSLSVGQAKIGVL